MEVLARELADKAASMHVGHLYAIGAFEEPGGQFEFSQRVHAAEIKTAQYMVAYIDQITNPTELFYPDALMDARKAFQRFL